MKLFFTSIIALLMIGITQTSYADACGPNSPLLEVVKTLELSNMQEKLLRSQNGAALVIQQATAESNLEYKVINSSMQIVLSGPGRVTAISPEGKTIVGSFGVREVSTGRDISEEDIETPMRKKLELSPSGSNILLSPNFSVGGGIPYGLMLEVVSANAELHKDYSSALAEILKTTSSFETQYYGKFISERKFVVYGRTKNSAYLSLFDLDQDEPVWSIPVANAGISEPRLLVKAGRIYLYVGNHVFEKGQWKSNPVLCAYSFGGSREWCRDGDHRILGATDGGILVYNPVTQDMRTGWISLLDHHGKERWLRPYLGKLFFWDTFAISVDKTCFGKITPSSGEISYYRLPDELDFGRADPILSSLGGDGYLIWPSSVSIHVLQIEK